MDKSRRKDQPEGRPERDSDVRKERREEPSGTEGQPIRRDRDMETPVPGSRDPEEEEE